jgi:glycosyltransferase involved in cell wall biosynthesis
VTVPPVETGLVSAIVPVFNRPALLREAVASVFAQTYRPVEVIVVDDGSTDETPQVCAELQARHAELRVLRVSNGGPGRAREAGRVLARGEFLQYLDSDDLLEPRKFELQVAALRARPECGICYCATYEHDVGAAPEPRPSAATGESWETLFPRLLAGRLWQTVTPLVRRSLSDAAGPWSELRQEEDWEYDARLGAAGARLCRVPEFLASFRHHGGPRAGGGSLGDPEKMRGRQRAHVSIYGLARRAGVGTGDPYMQRYARELFLLARQAGASGLRDESRELFDLARAASGAGRARGWDFRLYRALATLVGWRAAGRLSCWSDRFRPARAA